MPELTAAYSPEDNKLRLYASARLDTGTYERVKAAGFAWAPKQELFVAPMWTPERHDLLLELCGEIDAEDISLAERAAERAERFAGYQQARTLDANRAHDDARAIADHIPFGQPILVGHHSERRARRDAERIENHMRRAVSAWDSAEHWKHRAAGALRNAEHKGRTDVRHRRIKGLEADARKQQKQIAEAEELVALWSKEGLSLETAVTIAGFSHISWCFPLADYPRDLPKSQYEGEVSLYHALGDGIITVDQARELALAALNKRLYWHRRWLEHYTNRLVYERAMLEEQGGIAADRFDIQPGGQVLSRGEWATVTRVTRKGGKLVSVTTNARYVRVRGIEEVKDYRPPSPEQAAAAASTAKLPPLCNYPGEGFHHMTRAEWDNTHKDYKGSRELGTGAVRPGGYRPDLKNADAAGDYGRHRVRSVVRHGGLTAVFITDAKRTDPPAAPAVPAAPTPQLPAPERDLTALPASRAPSQQSGQFDALREQLRPGQAVQVATAPQLFPTPPELAARLVAAVQVDDGARILEPSAGTGNLVRALRATGRRLHIVAVEINQELAAGLTSAARAETQPATQELEVICGDFLESLAIGAFDAIVMNPPFANGQDIEHIRKAITLLKDGARLAAICANGSRQQAELRPLIEAAGGSWEPLPAGTFKESGTAVNAVFLTYQKR